jgi:hypothetical protein
MKFTFTGDISGRFEDILQEFNKKHNLDITMEEDDTQEVLRVTISSKKMTGKHAFELGHKYGIMVQELKNKGFDI